MAKKYVVGEAVLNCQYGEQDWLAVPGDRHIEIGGRRMANETDYKKASLKQGGFGSCCSPHITGYAKVEQTLHDFLVGNKLTNLHQLAVFPCQYEPGPQWMETKEDVYIAGYRALMEDSWTFCTCGLGFITLLNSGQSENPAEALEEQLKQLEAVVDTYIKENGLSGKSKNDLLNSVILWNGYGVLPWETKVSQELWDFGIYMEKNYPSLSNYFERGIYLFDEQTGANIDVSYMAGLSMAVTDSPNDFWKLLAGTAYEDEAIYNGYLEASRLEPSESAWEAMKKFLDYYNSPEYDGNARYTDYLEMPENYRAVYEEMYRQGSPMDRSYYAPGVPLDFYGDPNEIMEKEEKLSHWPEWSQEQKDLLILQGYLSSYVGEEDAEAFIRKVSESAGRERTSWKESNRGD